MKFLNTAQIKSLKIVVENIQAVINCAEDPKQSDISEHYDCQSEFNQALRLLKRVDKGEC